MSIQALLLNAGLTTKHWLTPGENIYIFLFFLFYSIPLPPELLPVSGPQTQQCTTLARHSPAFPLWVGIAWGLYLYLSFEGKQYSQGLKVFLQYKFINNFSDFCQLGILNSSCQMLVKYMLYIQISSWVLFIDIFYI